MSDVRTFALVVACLGLAWAANADQPQAAPQAQTLPPAAAAPPPTTATVQAKPAADTDDAKKICRRYKATGSRLADRTVCKTRAEWRDDNIEIRRQMNNHNRQTTNGG
jgi:hypothetical protein